MLLQDPVLKLVFVSSTIVTILHHLISDGHPIMNMPSCYKSTLVAFSDDHENFLILLNSIFAMILYKLVPSLIDVKPLTFLAPFMFGNNVMKLEFTPAKGFRYCRNH